MRCPRPVVNGVLLKPLPYADGEQFVALYSASFNQPEQRGAHRFPDLVEYDLDCWLRRAREASPSHVEEIETLVGMKARMAVALRARDEMLGVLVLGAPASRDRHTAEERLALRQCAEQLVLMIENAKLTARMSRQE